MAWPTPAGAIIADMDLPLQDRFPFYWWAQGAKFSYPEAAKHLFCRCGSAAEAFFFHPLSLMPGVQFAADRAILGGLEVIPQHRVQKYRIDFALHEADMRLAVEIDGRAFHHRNSDQVDADYLRARRITAAGYVVVRFTATEAFRDASECWRQLVAIADARLHLAR